MKFGYEGANLSELIRKYKVSNQMMAINFLDDKGSFIIPYNEEVEQQIQDYMIEQAKLRKENMDLNEYNNDLSRTVSLSLVGGGFSIFSTVGLITAEQIFTQSYFGSLLVYAGAITILSSLVAIKQNKKVKELKKYDIYLSIREQLDNICDTKLYEGVSPKRQSLNINTLDDYSLKELKDISSNLKKLTLVPNLCEDKKCLVKKKK